MHALAICQKLKICVSTGVNGKILKCAISWKRLIVEPSGRKFGTAVLQSTYLGYFRSPIPWVWFGVIIRVKCPILRFSNSIPLPTFTDFIQPNFTVSMLIMREYKIRYDRLYLTSGCSLPILLVQSTNKRHDYDWNVDDDGWAKEVMTFLPICQKLWHFVNTGPCGARNFKTLLHLQFLSDMRHTLR